MNRREQQTYLIWAAWVVLLAVVLIRYYHVPSRNIECYREGSVHWLAAEPLYDDLGVGFLYAPHAAVLYAPFAVLPPFWGDVLWRVVNLGIFAWGTSRLARVAFSPTTEFGLVSLFAIPLSLGSALNGQFNLVMAGFMMTTVAAVAERRWWSAAVYLWLAILLKPLAVVLLLLLAPLYPALLLRLFALVPAVAIFPFLAQSPGYVASQYLSFAENLTVSSSQGDVRPFTHIFSTLALAGIEVPHATRNALRALAAGLTFLLCWRASQRLKPGEAAFFYFSLSVAYLAVFNPRTEGLSYAILGPAIGAWFALHWKAWHAPHRAFALVLATALAAMILVNYEVGKRFFPARPSLLLTPIAGCLFFAALCLEAAWRTWSVGGRVTNPSADPARAPRENREAA